MQLHALKHLVEVVKALSRCDRVFVMGSSSLLPSFPDLGEEGGPLATTFDADFLLEPTGKQIADVLSEAIGANSFSDQFEGRLGEPSLG